MRENLRELYQAVILDHARVPRNFRRSDQADVTAHGDNPMCGDQVTVFLRFENGIITDASFVGQGCAISLASASLLTELLRGRTPQETRRLCAEFEDMCGEGELDETAVPEEDLAALERLRVFSGVRAFPVRIRCATLPWQATREALGSRRDDRNT